MRITKAYTAELDDGGSPVLLGTFAGTNCTIADMSYRTAYEIRPPKDGADYLSGVWVGYATYKIGWLGNPLDGGEAILIIGPEDNPTHLRDWRPV